MRIASALVIFVLAASALTAEAASRESFSASSYSPVDEPTNTTVMDAPNPTTLEATALAPSESVTTIPTEQTENQTESQPDEQPDEFTWDPKEGRFKNGYYPHSSYGRSTESAPAEGDLTNSYEAGPYVQPDSQPNEFTVDPAQSENEPDEFTFDPKEGRYKDGYHPHSSYAGAHRTSTKTTIDGFSVDPQDPNQGTKGLPEDFSNSYVTSPQTEDQPDEFTWDPKEGRFKNGYHPQSTYAGRGRTSTSTSTTINGVSLEPQDPGQETNALPQDFNNRYVTGYYPTIQYSQQDSQQTSRYQQGQFTTLPYPLSGEPFVPSGEGCRAGYWAAHTDRWPRFFTPESTVGDAFGELATETYGQTTILEGLLSDRTGPYDQLLKFSLAALINSYERGAFGIPHIKVIAQFNAALVSPEAAAEQAVLFETQNVASISAGTPCT